MSNIALSGNASGTGTLTIASQNTSSNYTLTIPNETGTLLTSVSTTVYPKGGPAFSAVRATTQTGVSSATWTKVQLATENFDTNSNFDSSTNYRFTPTVAGYYQFSGSLVVTGTGLTAGSCAIYKNGSLAFQGNYIANAVGVYIPVLSALIYANGSTDYFELYGIGTVTSGTVTFGDGQSVNSVLHGCLVRAA